MSLRGPQARSNLMKARRDCFSEFILSAAEGLARTVRIIERPRVKPEFSQAVPPAIYLVRE